MAYDGYLKFQTLIDNEQFTKVINSLPDIASKGFNAVTSAAELAFDGVEKAASLCADAVTASIQLTVDAMSAVGNQAISLVSLAVEVGSSFESSMSQVIATMGITKDSAVEIFNSETGETELVNAYETLAEKAKEMGATTKFTATEAADALNYLALAGYNVEKACNALPAVLNLAAAGGMDLAYTSDLVTDAMSALGIEATYDNLTHFSDVLAKTASKSNTSVAQLGEAMLVCGGQCRTAGIDLEDTATLLGIMADNGIKGSEGGTALRNLLKNLYTPTQAAADAMAELGIETDIDGNLRDAQDVLIDIMAAMENLSEADRMQYMSDIFDTRTIAAASATLNNSGERYDELYNAITDCDGACEQMAETMSDNLNGSITICQSAAQALGNTFYEFVADGLREVVDMASEWLTLMNDTLATQGFMGLATVVGDVIEEAIEYASETIPKITTVIDKVVSTLAKSITAKKANIGELTSGIILTIADSFINNLNIFYSTGWEMIAAITEGMAKKSQDITTIAKNSVKGIVSAISLNLPTIISSGIEIIAALIEGMTEAVNDPLILTQVAAAVSSINLTLIGEIPIFLEFATSAITYIAEAMVEHSTSFFGAAYCIVSTIGSYIIENISTLLQCAVDLIISFGNFLIEHSSEIVDAAVIIVTTLADFIIENIEPLATVALDIINKLATELVTEGNLDKLLPSVLEIVQSIADMIEDNLDELLDAATAIIGTLLRYVNNEQNQQQIFTMAGEIVGTLIAALCDPSTLESLEDFVTMLFFELAKLCFATDWSLIGDSIVEGIMSGILGVEFNLEEAEANFFMNSARGINSIIDATGLDIDKLDVETWMAYDGIHKSANGGTFAGGGGSFDNLSETSAEPTTQIFNINIGEERLDSIVANSIARNSMITGGGGY